MFIATLRGPPPNEVLNQFLDLFKIHTTPAIPLWDQADRLAKSILTKISWARAFLPFRPEGEYIPSTLDILANVLEGG